MTALDNALVAIDAATANADDAGQLLVRAKVRGLMRGYDARWRDAGYKALSVESYVEADLVNIETQRKSRTFRIAGKLDVVAEYNGRRVLLDHKTTSSDIADPNAPYWRQLVVEGQASHYLLLEWLNGRKIDTAVWDCIKKPGIRPKKLTKAERANAVARRSYCDGPLSAFDLERLQTEETEALAMYESRLAQECLAESDKYFQRRGVPRLDSDLHEYAIELWEHGQEILHARNTGRWARNSGACLLYGSPCQFLGICSGHDSADSDKWQRKKIVHRELPIVEGDGRDLITNSRIRTFQTCRRKHYFDYELGIERIDEEERESLYFGSLMHVALEAWWLSFIGEDHVNSNADGCAANGVAQPTIAPVPAHDAGPSYW